MSQLKLFTLILVLGGLLTRMVGQQTHALFKLTRHVGLVALVQGFLIVTKTTSELPKSVVLIFLSTEGHVLL